MSLRQYEMNELEQQLLDALMRLRDRYIQEAQPIIDRLAYLQSLKPIPPVFIPNGDVVSNYFEASDTSLTVSPSTPSSTPAGPTPTTELAK